MGSAQRVELSDLHFMKDRAAGGNTQQGEIGVEMLLFFLQEEIKDENAQSEQDQFHLRQDDQAIAVDVRE